MKYLIPLWKLLCSWIFNFSMLVKSVIMEIYPWKCHLKIVKVWNASTALNSQHNLKIILGLPNALILAELVSNLIITLTEMWPVCRGYRIYYLKWSLINNLTQLIFLLSALLVSPSYTVFQSPVRKKQTFCSMSLIKRFVWNSDP